MAKYGMSTRVSGTVAEVKPRLQAALKDQGFGILTEIDVQKVMKEKINVDYEPYFILGACNPQIANQALSADRAMGLLLPCNVIIRQVGVEVEVSIQNPEVLFGVVDAATFAALGDLPVDARRRLSAALASLGAGGTA